MDTLLIFFGASLLGIVLLFTIKAIEVNSKEPFLEGIFGWSDKKLVSLIDGLVVFMTKERDDEEGGAVKKGRLAALKFGGEALKGRDVLKDKKRDNIDME